jgi:hypothetical protein
MSTLTLPEGLVVAAPAKPASSRKVFTALPSKIQLGELLLRSGHLTQDELESALSEHKAKGLKLGEALLHLGFVDEETLLRCLGQQLNIPFVRVREGTCDPAVVKLVPRSKSEAYCALAMFLVRGTSSRSRWPSRRTCSTLTTWNALRATRFAPCWRPARRSKR